MNKKPNILCLVSYYLPGYKAGGPLRTISNMVECLGDQFDFWIVTRDRDLGDSNSYSNVPVNTWVKLDGAMVYYASPGRLSLAALTKLINKTPHDLIYLNSFFDTKFTFRPLLARYLGRLVNKPVILASRGEFSTGALRLKRYVKRIYIVITKLLGLYSGVHWQASSVHELEDIVKTIKVSNHNITVASDLPSISVFKKDIPQAQLLRNNNSIKIIFLSRISPMKNLDYALEVLSSVHVNVIFDIYGPKEDLVYWQCCEEIIKNLPENIACNYCGVVKPDEITQVFSQYDLFLFPTRGENYGHVIAESLSVGTPVLISDRTPWRELQKDDLGIELSLDAQNDFVAYIEGFSKKHVTGGSLSREGIRKNAFERLISPETIDSNRALFFSVIDKASRNSA